MGTTRRQALLAAGAALAVPAVALADADQDRAKAALIAVLRLEQTALVGYEAIANSGVLKDVLRGFLDQERQHVAQLQTALDGMGAKAPIPPRRADIQGLDEALRSRPAAARFAIDLELRTIAAYQTALRDLTDSNVMRVSAGAMGTDAQQVVILRQVVGEDPLPHAIETGRSP
jgi:ferritin-like protein